MTDNNESLLRNIHNELLLVGSFYKSPDLYIKQGHFIRSKYDFSDEATKFYYDCFELMYKTYTQTIDEFKVNTFMTQDAERFKEYCKFGKFETIKAWMNMADLNDVDNYFNIVKKFSLVREYSRNGYPVEKIVSHPKFQTMTAEEVYRAIRSKADKINTIILCNKDSSVINSNATETIKGFLLKPQMGLEMPWRVPNDLYRGCRLGKVIFDGLLSNEGKTRKLMLLASYITMIKKEKFFLASNEMDEEDLRSCMITTVLNNKVFKDVHGVKLMKPEKEIVLGLYKDDNGKYLTRLVDSNGDFIESEEEFVKRVEKNSFEFREVSKVGEWVDATKDTQLFFMDVGMDYSDQKLEFEFRKHNTLYGVKYAGYDTLKGYGTDDWQTVKQTATKLKELMKEIDMFLYSVFQLTDDSIEIDIFDFSSKNIANAKQMKHVVDHLSMGKKLLPNEYNKYRYVDINNSWGEPSELTLNTNKTYYGFKTDKNRGGNKADVALFEVDLDYNIWNNIGVLKQNTR